MIDSPVTIPIAFVHGMLSGLRLRGEAFDSYLDEAGIAAELLERPGARVTAAQYVLLFQSLTERRDDDFLGFFSRPLRRGSFALMARSAIGADRVEVAMRRVARSFGLLQDDVVLETVRVGEHAGWSLRHADQARARPQFMDEFLLRVFWRLLAWLAGGRLQIEGFDFAFDCPPYAAGYNKIFPAPLSFASPHSGFRFDASLLEAPVRRDESALHVFLADSYANFIVPRRGDDVVSARVRQHLQLTLTAWPDLIATAEALHMAVSTLQRHLATEGTSFQALKNELRRDLAIAQLNVSTAPLAALADELGFADSAAFQRAFKRWTGSSPGAYRRGES